MRFRCTPLVLSALLALGLGFAQGERVEISSGEQAFPAYLAVPEGDGENPAIVLLHSIMGRQPGYETVSDDLAEEGFVVLALEWQTFEDEPPLETLDALLRDSLEFLRARKDVLPDAIGLTGFCIGGYHTMYFLPTIPDFAAGVAWYGFPNRGEEGNRPTDPEIVEQLDAPMLIIHGTADEPSPIGDIYDYATVLDENEKYFELAVYQGEPHSFLVSGERLETPAADAAYEQMVAFFSRTLTGDATTP